MVAAHRFDAMPPQRCFKTVCCNYCGVHRRLFALSIIILRRLFPVYHCGKFTIQQSHWAHASNRKGKLTQGQAEKQSDYLWTTTCKLIALVNAASTDSGLCQHDHEDTRVPRVSLFIPGSGAIRILDGTWPNACRHMQIWWCGGKGHYKIDDRLSEPGMWD